ncbi:hypothetical protein QSH57_002517 [Fusarium oxysporum f. sp. vasinfectum]|nr:hypothetical protein QSH57_002517 [Fusarium oxysporum f. sp. vasinfectum]
MARKGRTKRGPKKGRRNSRAPQQIDWTEFLKNGAIAVLEYFPIVDKLISQFRPDPVEQRLAEIGDAIEDLAPHLLEQLDYLQDICGTLDVVSQAVSEQTFILEGIKDSLTTFRSPDVLGQFTAITVLAQAVADIKRLADAAEKISGSLKGIEVNLSSVNLGGDYFPGRVHSYVREMIEMHALSDVPHYFTVFHQGTVWWPKFADLVRSDPLGPQFLGRKSDLDELCVFLADEVRPRVGKEAVLHILMPTVGQVAMKEAVQLPDAMYPCVIDGQLGDAGCPFVYMCLPRPQDQSCLRNIGVLTPRDIWASRWMAGACLPVVSQWLTYDCGITWHVDAFYGILAGGYFRYGPEPARTLGRPIEQGSRPWNE